MPLAIRDSNQPSFNGAKFAKNVRFAESWQVSEYGAPVSDALKELLIGLD